MKARIKYSLNSVANTLATFLGNTLIGHRIYDKIIKDATSWTTKVEHHGVNLTFAVPDALNKYRVDTFSTKEPETLDWIDSLRNVSVFWDIGANIGLFSCYAAKRHGCRVFAFEPSVFNLELLARNIYLNKLTDLVTIIPLPLCEKLTDSKLNMTTTARGGALSTFGQNYGYDGQTLTKAFEFRTVGLSMVDAVKLLKIPQPDYVKMDVDGIEHLILQGGLSILQRIQGILIEINDEFAEQFHYSASYLRRAGLTLTDKTHSRIVENSSFRSAFNQIWSRIIIE